MYVHVLIPETAGGVWGLIHYILLSTDIWLDFLFATTKNSFKKLTGAVKMCQQTMLATQA